MADFQGRLLKEALRVLDEQHALIADAVDRDLGPDEMLLLLAEIGRRSAEVRKLLARIGSRSGLPSNAKARILRYFVLTKGKVVNKEELSGVSGIYEWARRVRELRVEEGWPISSSENRPELRPGQYLLEAGTPDNELRERWQIANYIRRSPGSAPERLIAFLEASQGHTVSRDEIFYVTKDHDFDEIIRTLVKQGYPIRSSANDPTLKPGQYRFERA